MSELAPEGAPVEPTEPVVEEPAFSVSPEEWQATQERLAQFEQMLQPPQPWQQQQWQPQGPPRPDPWERPDTFQQDLDMYIDSRLQFVQNLQQEMVDVEGHQAAMAMLDTIAARDSLGEINKEMAWTVARQMVQNGEVAPPQNERESERILEAAAKQIADYERRVSERYHQQQLEQLQTAAGAPRGIPATMGGAQTLGVGGYGKEPFAVLNRVYGRS